MFVENAQHRYVVEVKSLSVPRRSEAKAFLAAAYLQARTYAEKLKAQPLPIFAAPSISRALARELAEYAAEHFPHEPWRFVDSERVSLHGPGLKDIRIEPSPVPKRVVPASRLDPFSDLNQWMLKVLLAPKIEPKYLAEQLQRAPIRNASMLADVAKVSVPSAARFVAHFRKEGFLESGRSLRLVQVRKLLESWRVSIRAPVEVCVRWLLPSRSPASALDELVSSRHAKRCISVLSKVRLNTSKSIPSSIFFKKKVISCKSQKRPSASMCGCASRGSPRMFFGAGSGRRATGALAQTFFSAGLK